VWNKPSPKRVSNLIFVLAWKIIFPSLQFQIIGKAKKK
jgi:hypothetical protein